MSSTKNHTTVRSTRTTYFPIAGSLYATGTEFSSYYIANLNTGTKRTFTSPSAFEWSLRVLESAAKPIVARWRVASLILYIAANRKPAPQPTPPAAAALRIVPQTSVYAVSNPKQEHKVNIPSQTVGEWRDRTDLPGSIKWFKSKHGVRPSHIRLPFAEAAHWTKFSYYGIPVSFADSIPVGKCHLVYNPIAEVA